MTDPPNALDEDDLNAGSEMDISEANSEDYFVSNLLRKTLNNRQHTYRNCMQIYIFSNNEKNLVGNKQTDQHFTKH